MFEPIIKTDISHLPKTIETNLGDLEPFIAEKVKQAKSLVVNADCLEDCEKAEADASLLTKMAKRISEFRLTWTKQWQSPFETVIAKCKDYENRLKNAGDELRAKAKVGRDAVKKAKKEELKSLFDGIVKDVFKDKQYPFFKTYFEFMCDESTKGCWLNRTKKVSAIEQEMRATVNDCAIRYNELTTMFAGDCDEIKQVVEEVVGKAFDATEVITAVNNHRQFMERREARAEALRKAQEAAASKTVRQTTSAPVTPSAPIEPPKVMTQEEVNETYNLAITGKRSALIALRKYGESLGITFKKI